jgi:hypothetical protein
MISTESIVIIDRAVISGVSAGKESGDAGVDAAT